MDGKQLALALMPSQDGWLQAALDLMEQGHTAVRRRQYSAALDAYVSAYEDLHVEQLILSGEGQDAQWQQQKLQHLVHKVSCSAALAAMYTENPAHVEVAIRSAEIAADNTSMTDIPRYLLALQRHLEVLALKYKLITIKHLEEWATGALAAMHGAWCSNGSGSSSCSGSGSGCDSSPPWKVWWKRSKPSLCSPSPTPATAAACDGSAPPPAPVLEPFPAACPPDAIVHHERHVWCSTVTSTDQRDIVGALARLTRLLTREPDSSSQHRDIDSRTTQQKKLAPGGLWWPPGIPAAYGAPLTNPAVRAWLRASRVLQDSLATHTKMLGEFHPSLTPLLLTVDLLDGAGHARSLFELIQQINSGKHEGVQRSHLTIGTTSPGPISTNIALKILLVGDQDASLVDALGSNLSLHMNGPTTLIGLPRSGTSPFQLVLPARLGMPYAITVHATAEAAWVNFLGIWRSHHHSTSAATSATSTAGNGTTAKDALQSGARAGRGRPPVHSNSDTVLAADSSTSPDRPQNVSMDSLARGCSGGLIQLVCHATQGTSPEQNLLVMSNCGFGPSCTCEDCLLPGTAVRAEGHNPMVVLESCVFDRCFSGLVLWPQQQALSLVSYNTQFHRCGVGLLALKGRSIVTWGGSNTSQTAAESTRQHSHHTPHGAPSTTGSAASFVYCGCAVCVYGERTLVTCEDVVISHCGNQHLDPLTLMDCWPEHVGGLSPVTVLDGAVIELVNCHIKDCRGGPAVRAPVGGNALVLKRTTISGCDAGIYTSGAGGLFLMGSSTCTNSLTYGAYLGSACRAVDEVDVAKLQQLKGVTVFTDGWDAEEEEHQLVIKGSGLYDAWIPAHAEATGQLGRLVTGGTVLCASERNRFCVDHVTCEHLDEVLRLGLGGKKMGGGRRLPLHVVDNPSAVKQGY